MDAGVDTGSEQVPFSGDFLLSSAMESAFSMGNIPMLDGFLHNRGAVATDFGYYTDVL